MILSDEELAEARNLTDQINLLLQVGPTYDNTLRPKTEREAETMWNMDAAITEMKTRREAIMDGALRRWDGWRDYDTIKAYQTLMEEPIPAQQFLSGGGYWSIPTQHGTAITTLAGLGGPYHPGKP